MVNTFLRAMATMAFILRIFRYKVKIPYVTLRLSIDLPIRYLSSCKTFRLNTKIIKMKTPRNMLYTSRTASTVEFVLNVEIISNTQEIPMTVSNFKFIVSLIMKS